MNEYIQIMIQQFCKSPDRLKAMVGGSNFVYDNEQNLFRFRFKMCKKANACELKYSYGLDFYEMTFYKVGKIEWDVVADFTHIYADKLVETFEGFTGLYLSLL